MDHKLIRLIPIILLSSQSLLCSSQWLDSLDRFTSNLVDTRVNNKKTDLQKNELTKYGITIATYLTDPDDSTFWTIYAQEIIKQARQPHAKKSATTIANPGEMAHAFLHDLKNNQSSNLQDPTHKVFIPQPILYDLYDVANGKPIPFHELPTTDLKLPIKIIPQTMKSIKN